MRTEQQVAVVAQRALRIQGLTLDTPQANAAQASLRSRGLSLRQENNDVWLLQAEAAR